MAPMAIFSDDYSSVSGTSNNVTNSAEVQPQRVIETDVFIAGSGPTGATYARKLVDAGISVYMVDIGAQETAIPGDHKKNNVVAQKDVNGFTSVVQGDLDLLSVPTDNGTVANGQNPEQDAHVNLPAAAATRTVGGMGSHWTCCTPRQHPTLERSDLFSDSEWERLYTEAESRMKTNHTTFDSSIRQQLVKRTLRSGNAQREFVSMPLAVEEVPDQTYLEWSCSKTILGPIARGPDQPGSELFTLKSQTRCTKLVRNGLDSKAIDGALCKDLKSGKSFLVKAKKYIVCAGAVLTPGILYNSGWKPETNELPALGHYLTERTMAFCQVMLKRSLIDQVPQDPHNLGWKAKVAKHQASFPQDPLPIPFDDADPQVYTPVSEAYPWQAQVHRDAYSYGAVPATVDQRTVVDLRWFGQVAPVYDNCVSFTNTKTDQFGMPQPTFNFTVPQEDAERSHRMMADMCDVAGKLGGFLPGAEPKFLPAGSALHISGTTRAGKSVDDSVCDRFGKVWGTDDLYVGGCSVIPTGAASSPTLTAMCFAIAGADNIVSEIGKRSVKASIASAKKIASEIVQRRTVVAV